MAVSNKAESWHIYRAELERQGHALIQRLPAIAAQASAIVAQLDLQPQTQLYLAGSGDSYIAAVACQYAFHELVRLPTMVVEAFDVAPYYVPLLQPHTLLITTSISGKTSSVIAALEAAKRQGVHTLLITNSPGSPAMSLVEDAIVLDVPSIDTSGFIPSTLSYMGGMIAQHCVAIALAERLQTETHARLSDYRSELARALTTLDELLAALDEPIKQFMQRWGQRRLCIIGGGASYGTALFGAAKVIESAMVPVTVQHVEEWAHIQRCLTGPDTPSIFLATPGRSYARMLEIMRAARTLGTEVIAIGEAADAEVAALADEVWPVPPLSDETLQPLICAIPMELLAYWCMVDQDVRPFNADRRPIDMRLTIPPT